MAQRRPSLDASSSTSTAARVRALSLTSESESTLGKDISPLRRYVKAMQPLRFSKENREMQTEASFYPESLPDATKHFDTLEAQEMQTLRELRGRIGQVMGEVGGSIYDLFNYKDIMLAMKGNLPGAPLTDLLLISSKLFRRGSELSKLLSTFFNICFADDFVDEHFHFTEMRHLKKEMTTLRTKLHTTQKERDSYKEQLENLKASSHNHVAVLEELEDRNETLELRGAALEDQMALLFHQLTEDFLFYNEAALQRTGDDLEVQEKFSAVRSSFSQSIDLLQGRLKFFQQMLSEIQEEGGAGAHGAVSEQHTAKSKMRALEVHIQHIAGRFAAVKDGLATTAQDLTTALLEKKKILNFSVHHLRAYEVQNYKLRSARAALHDVRKQLHRLEQTVSQTFPTGSIMQVDRGGTIEENVQPLLPPGSRAAVVTPGGESTGGLTTTPQRSSARRGSVGRTSGDETDGSEGPSQSKRFAAQHISSIQNMIFALQDTASQMTADLATDDDHRALMRTLTLAVPSSTRDPTAVQSMKERMHNVMQFGSQLGGDGQHSSHGAASATSLTGAFQSSGTMQQHASSGTGGSHGVGGSSARSAVSHDQYIRLREDFAVKVTFLREVYEERIADLELRNERLQKKLFAAEHPKEGSAPKEAAMAAAVEALGAKVSAAASGGGDGGDGGRAASPTAELLPPQSPLGTDLETSEEAKTLQEKAKEKWADTKESLHESDQGQKHTVLSSLNELQEQLTDDRSVRTSYVSPLYTQELMAQQKPSRPTPPPSARTVEGGVTAEGTGRSTTSTTVRSSVTAEGSPTPGSQKATILAPTRGFSGAALSRTAHSKQVQEKNVEVLRTLRRLAGIAETSKESTAGPSGGGGTKGGGPKTAR